MLQLCFDICSPPQEKSVLQLNKNPIYKRQSRNKFKVISQLRRSKKIKKSSVLIAAVHVSCSENGVVKNNLYLSDITVVLESLRETMDTKRHVMSQLLRLKNTEVSKHFMIS